MENHDPNTNSDSGRPEEPLAVPEPGKFGEFPEETIVRLIFARFEKTEVLRVGDRETVAYRISEIMSLAKDLYTTSLPRLLVEGGTSEAMEEELAGLRMGLLHMRDLVTDFDSAYLESMTHERDASPDAIYDDWKPGEGEEWTADDLGVDQEELEEE